MRKGKERNETIHGNNRQHHSCKWPAAALDFWHVHAQRAELVTLEGVGDGPALYLSGLLPPHGVARVHQLPADAQLRERRRLGDRLRLQLRLPLRGHGCYRGGVEKLFRARVGARVRRRRGRRVLVLGAAVGLL